MTPAVVFCDIAGTIVQTEPWRYVRQHPSIDKSSKRRAMARILPLWAASKVGLVPDVWFRHQWLLAMASLFRNWKRDQLQALFEWVVYDQMKALFYEDVIARLRQHQRDGARLVLVSGVFQEFARVYAQRVGADDAIGTPLQFVGDVCTGRVAGPTCVGERKVMLIRDYLGQLETSPPLSNCYAYADSYSDHTMLEAVGHGVATYPDPRLRHLASQKGWEIFS